MPTGMVGGPSPCFPTPPPPPAPPRAAPPRGQPGGEGCCPSAGLRRVAGASARGSRADPGHVLPWPRLPCRRPGAFLGGLLVGLVCKGGCAGQAWCLGPVRGHGGEGDSALRRGAARLSPCLRGKRFVEIGCGQVSSPVVFMATSCGDLSGRAAEGKWLGTRGRRGVPWLERCSVRNAGVRDAPPSAACPSVAPVSQHRAKPWAVADPGSSEGGGL